MMRYKRVLLALAMFFSIGLLFKFVFDLGAHPTSSLIIGTMFGLALGVLGSIVTLNSHLAQMADQDARVQYVQDLLNRFTVGLVFALTLCIVANLVFPLSGIATTVLIWILGHSVVAALVCSLVALGLSDRLRNMKAQ